MQGQPPTSQTLARREGKIFLPRLNVTNHTLALEKAHLPELEGAPWFELSSGAASCLVSPHHFAPITSRDTILAVSKHALTQVVIETSSFCNRKCIFCPNKLGVRKNREFLDWPTYQRILSDLEQISFSGSVLFHLYNEPLADDHIYRYVEAARRTLPRARLGLNSNGDYLTPDILKTLTYAGLTQLNVSLYGKNPGNFDRDYITRRLSDMINTLGITQRTTSGPLDIRTNIGGLSIRIFAQDFVETGYDRGGLLDSGLRTERQAPCTSPFKEILVGYDGSVIPCCNIHPTVEDHRDYIVGHATPTSSILEIYASASMATWRRELVQYENHAPPCKSCTRMNYQANNDIEVIEFTTACKALLNNRIQTSHAKQSAT